MTVERVFRKPRECQPFIDGNSHRNRRGGRRDNGAWKLSDASERLGLSHGSVDLGSWRGALAGAPEMRNLLLQKQQAVEERLRWWRASRNVHVDGNHPVDTFDDVIPVPERAA